VNPEPDPATLGGIGPGAARPALLNGDGLALRRTRRRVIRLAKAWNKQWISPGFSSFHLSALALEHVTAEGERRDRPVRRFRRDAATFPGTGCNTADPAGVSKPLKLMPQVSRDVVVHRLRAAATAMAEALDHDDDQTRVQSALHRLLRDYIDPPVTDPLAAAAAALRPRGPDSSTVLGRTGHGVAIPGTRAFGGRRP
jgi:hypothetical protein